MVQYCLLKVIVSEKWEIYQEESTNRVLEGSKIRVKMMKLAGIPSIYGICLWKGPGEPTNLF